VTIKTDPDIVIFVPIGLKKRVFIRMGMDACFPFFIDLLMTLATFLGL
jgi:hypothetical protein